MKLKRDEYFNLLEDELIYKANKEEIDKFIVHNKEKQLKVKNTYQIKNSVLSQSEIDDLLSPVIENTRLECPKDIEISDSEYERLTQQSSWLNTYEGGSAEFSSAFWTYRDKLEKEKSDNRKLKKIIEGLMNSYVEHMDEKIAVLLDILL